MILEPDAPLPGGFETTKIRTVLCISYDYEASRPPPVHFQNRENADCLIYFLWFWSQSPPSHPLPKTWKWWWSFAFLMILKPAAALPPTFKTMKMLTALCISFDNGVNSPLPRHFQNHENDNSPMHFLWCCGLPPPSRPLPQPWKCWQSYAFPGILKPIARLPPTSKDMTMMRVLCIFNGSEASHPLPKPWKWWQSYAFLMILKPIAPLPPSSIGMKMMADPYISYDSEATRPLPTHFQKYFSGANSSFLQYTHFYIGGVENTYCVCLEKLRSKFGFWGI